MLYIGHALRHTRASIAIQLYNAYTALYTIQSRAWRRPLCPVSPIVHQPPAGCVRHGHGNNREVSCVLVAMLEGCLTAQQRPRVHQMRRLSRRLHPIDNELSRRCCQKRVASAAALGGVCGHVHVAHRSGAMEWGLRVRSCRRAAPLSTSTCAAEAADWILSSMRARGEHPQLMKATAARGAAT